MFNIVVLYASGHLAVLIAGYLFFRVLRREPDLAGRRQLVFEMNDRSARIEADEAEIKRSVTESDSLKVRIDDVQKALKNRVRLQDAPSTKWAFAWLSGVITEGEAAVFYLLASASGLLGLPAESWAFLSPVIAVAWVLVLHVLIGAVVADKHRPARTVRRARMGAVLLGGGVVGAVWLILSGRNLTDPSLIEQLTTAGLLILAALLSVCGAFCTIVTTTLFESEWNDRVLVRLERRLEMYRQHIELLERDLIRLKGDPGPGDGSAGFATPVLARVISMLVLLSMILGAPGVGYAQLIDENRPVAATLRMAQEASAINFARAEACEMVVDVTGSIEQKSLQVAIGRIAEQLPAIADSFGCKVLRLTPFAGDPFISIEEFDLTVVVDAGTECSTSTATAASATARASEVLFPRVAEAHQRQARDACIARQKAAAEHAAAQRAAILARAADRLRALGDLAPRGPCTALFQAVQRALQRSQHLVVISDMQASCPPPSTRTIVPLGSKILFLIVPPNAQGPIDRANILLNGLTLMERAFPGSRALLEPEATPAFWRQLAEEQ